MGMTGTATDLREKSRWFRWRWKKHLCWSFEDKANEHGGHCKRFAWLEDWTGYRYCFKHWYRSNKWGGGDRWFDFKRVRIIL